MTESEIVEKLIAGDDEFHKLYFEHRELDEVVRSLESKESLSFDDEVEVKRLKKIKLSLKDRIEAKIAEWKHRVEA